MDYRVADFIIRTEGVHEDIVACGLKGFQPFVTEDAAHEEATMILNIDTPIESANYVSVKDIHEFDFEKAYAVGKLSRYATGYVYTTIHEDKSYLFIKEDGSNTVYSDLGCDGEVDSSLLRFGIWIMFGIIIAPLGGIAIHSSVIVKDDAGLLCLGESGTGKSTHTRLWRENIEGAKLLNDDSPIIRMVDGVAYVYGSPWSGKTPCYVNKRVPIRGFMRLSQAPHNKIKRLHVLTAIGALLPSCPPSFAYDDTLQDHICTTLSDMIASTPVYHLECLPNAEAAQLSYNTIYGGK